MRIAKLTSNDGFGGETDTKGHHQDTLWNVHALDES